MIESQPEGYQNDIKLWEAALAGGQKRRLASVQVLTKLSKILIFYEATDNLSKRTEDHFAHSIEQRMGNMTAPCITRASPKKLLLDAVVRIGL
ncbi:hypothetical protein [Rhodoferax sp. GW822-FHT02A01]|uniref:hypothetical protein n=1 Tax=Rhodoferax sp. GW822-FHT02A01 TaxID=3141537 RepID=UPI00315CC214